ncbi:MAG: TSUP family transporter [Desulforhopalus sp.]
MEPYQISLFFFIICGFAATVHGAVGIGFPMIATPLLSMVTDVRTAILVLVIPTIVLNITNTVKGGSWDRSIVIFWPLAFYGMIGSFLGTRLLILVPAESFRPLLAGAILLYLNAERIGAGFNWIERHPRVAMAFFGLSAGLLGGTVNVMLPALVIFALEVKMDKTAMIQVFNFCFLSGKLTQGSVFLSAGLLTPYIIKISIPLAFVSFVVMLIAMPLRSRLDESVYRRWLRRLLLIMALVLIIQFLTPYFV